MGRYPAALLPLITAGLGILPGCVVVPTPGEAPARPAAARRAGEAFATHRTITRPGEVVRPNAVAAGPSPGPVNPIPDPPAPAQLDITGVTVPSAERVVRAIPAPTPPPDPPLVAAVRAYLEKRPDRVVEHLRPLDPASQELLIRLIPAVAHAAQAKLGDPADAADLAAKTEAAAEAVARVAPLGIGKVAFVNHVLQFGVYNPLPPGYGFLPGGTAQLYVELRNAPSEATPHPGGGDGYVTRLNCELRVLDAAGKLLARYDPSNVRDMAVNDYTRSRLHDVFLRLSFSVPGAPGAYTAEFTVHDPATGRSARKVVEFAVRP